MIKEKKEAHKSAQKRFTHSHSSAVLAALRVLFAAPTPPPKPSVRP